MSGMGGGARCHHIVNTTMMSSWEFSLKLTINAHTCGHTCAIELDVFEDFLPDAGVHWHDAGSDSDVRAAVEQALGRTLNTCLFNAPLSLNFREQSSH